MKISILNYMYIVAYPIFYFQMYLR